MKLFKFLTMIAVAFGLMLLMGNATTLSDVVPMMAAAPLIIQFSKQLEKKLRPDSAFYTKCVDESMYIAGVKVVRPVTGADPTVITNPSVFPLTVTEISDDDNEYTIARHVVGPRRIDDEARLIRNYDMMANEARTQADVLIEGIANETLFNWQPTSIKHIATTGATVASSLGIAGQNRKAVTKEDFIMARTALSRDNALSGDIYALINASMYGQLLGISDFIDYNKTGRSDLLLKGIIGEICGIKIMERSIAAIYDSANAAKKIAALTANTDRAGIVIWNASHVYGAVGKGGIDENGNERGLSVYWNPAQATMLGGVMSTAVRAGGNKRKDQKGVVAIVEAIV